MLQGITVAASEVFQVMPFLMFAVVGKFLDKTPRAKYDRWSALSSISWGDTYPKLTNLAVIGKSTASSIEPSPNITKSTCVLLYCTIGSLVCYYRPRPPLPSVPLQRLLHREYSYRYER